MKEDIGVYIVNHFDGCAYSLLGIYSTLSKAKTFIEQQPIHEQKTKYIQLWIIDHPADYSSEYIEIQET